MGIAVDEPTDPTARLKRRRRLALLVAAATALLALLVSVYFWYSLTDPFLDRELDGLVAPQRVDLVGDWRTAEAFGTDHFHQAYVTDLDISEACEAITTAIETWGGRNTGHPLAGLDEEENRCIAQFSRRSVWSLFQASTINVTVQTYAGFNGEYGGGGSSFDDPAPELPAGYRTAIVVTVDRSD